MNVKHKTYWLTLILFVIIKPLYSQENTVANWDNELWMGTRFSWGQKKLKYTGEFQSRFNQDYTQLENWYIEGSIHFLANKYIEIVADARNSVSPSGNSFRPGIAAVGKIGFNKFFIINQIKLQSDNTFTPKTSYALREVMYLNYAINTKWTPYIGGGVFFRDSDNFKGLQVIRAGVGVYYNYNPLHSLSINYFVGQRNLGSYKTLSGILLVQLTIKFSNDYIYMPAKYINF